MNSRTNRKANSQHDEKARKLLHKMLNSNRAAGGKIILLLFVEQPLNTEEICTKVGIKEKTFRYALSVKLIKEDLIKPLPGDRWALLDYEPLASKQKYGESDIVRLIDVLENDKMSQELKVSAGTKLRRRCSWEGVIVGGKNKLRPFFLKVLDNPESYEVKVLTDIYIALEYYVANQLQGEEDIQWMKKECYNKLVSLFNESGSIRRDRILNVLSRIYGTNELDMKQQYELTYLLRKKFFDPKEDGSIVNRCWDILWDWADDELKETLGDDFSSLAKSWDTFWDQADDELKEILDDVVSNMTPAEKEILEKRGLEAMEKIL